MTAQTTLSQSKDIKSVQVFLSVDGKDAPTTAPALPDLSVYVDKQPAKVASLRSAKNDPLLFALVIDTSASEAKRADATRDAAQQIFEALSKGGSRGYLVIFGSRVLTSNAPVQSSSAQTALDHLQFGGGSAVFDAVGVTCTRLLTRLANPDAPRRVILLLSDGDDNMSHITPSEAEQDAVREGIAIFSLSSGSTPHGEHFLQEASKETGGQWIATRNPGDGVKTLLAAIDRQWVLTLLPPESPDQKLHAMQIKSSEKGLRISAPAQIPLE